jgi:alkylated DNA repair dioxygenase AlkB
MRNIQTEQKIDLELADRSLLLMYNLQNGWQHSLPKSKTRLAPRINLTFRNVHAM